jgi:hypothetical protein
LSPTNASYWSRGRRPSLSPGCCLELPRGEIHEYGPRPLRPKGRKPDAALSSACRPRRRR